MTKFDLKDFTPYLLAIAAETTSEGFERHYKNRYGMLRTEWRVMFHLGRYGPLTAKEICQRARIHKTKVSRAVAALEAKRFLHRTQLPEDRRLEMLELTTAGHRAYNDLYDEAARFDRELLTSFTEAEHAVLQRCLTKIADL